MSVEAQVARLENAIRSMLAVVHGEIEGAWNEDLREAARIGSAASSGIGWTRQGAPRCMQL